MSKADDRRERYAVAQYALSEWAARVAWERLEQFERAEWYPAADAAMAVADAEHNDFVGRVNAAEHAARLTASDNARLRDALHRIDSNIQNGGSGGPPELIWSIRDIVGKALS